MTRLFLLPSNRTLHKGNSSKRSRDRGKLQSQTIKNHITYKATNKLTPQRIQLRHQERDQKAMEILTKPEHQLSFKLNVLANQYPTLMAQSHGLVAKCTSVPGEIKDWLLFSANWLSQIASAFAPFIASVKRSLVST